MTELRCADWGREQREGERFRAYLTVDDEVEVFCPGCAEREFGEESAPPPRF